MTARCEFKRIIKKTIVADFAHYSGNIVERQVNLLNAWGMISGV
jgi:hypothetical protein